MGRAMKHELPFIKGNIDSVTTLLLGDPGTVRRDARWRVEVGKPGGGNLLLSAACSVAPRVSLANLRVLAEGAEEFGR